MLGAADIALRRTVPALVAHPDVTVVVVSSRDAARAARFAESFGCEAVPGHQALLDRDDIDALGWRRRCCGVSTSWWRSR